MLKSLSVKNFRNLSITDLKLKPGVTVIVGGNGQGKTNLIEAVYVLSYGRPFRGEKKETINWNSQEAEIFGETTRGTIRIFLRRDGETRVVVNNKTKPLAAVFGRFVSVLFHPGEIELIGGPPALRRSWLDKLIATIDRSYLFDLVNYNRTIINRNRLLKISGGKAAEEELETWDRVLAKYGVGIWKTRETQLEALNRIIRKSAIGLVGKQLSIDYKIPIGLVNEQADKKSFLGSLKERRGLDRRILLTSFGPHRDDFRVIVEEADNQTIIEKDIGLFGSRAEQRQATILLNLACAELFSQVFGEAPTILLDDVTSELDEKNKNLLLTHINAQQILITVSSLDQLTDPFRRKATVFKIDGGKIIAP